MIKTVLFDLDSTLLPMDEKVFTRAYFGALAKKLAPYGYSKEDLVNAVWAGTGAMVKNDGKKYNHEVFWEKFGEIFGEKAKKDRAVFDAFYEEEFLTARDGCGYDPMAKVAVEELKKRGIRVAVASNPIFPKIAQETRMRWAGVDPKDFLFVTSYEDCRFSKPNPLYYVDLLQKNRLEPAETLMVGNNVDEDMVAQEVGCEVFLLPARLINLREKDISVYPQGDFSDLIRFVDEKNRA